MFLLFVHRDLIFHLIFNEFLRKIPFRKMHRVMIVHIKFFDTKEAQKGEIVNI